MNAVELSAMLGTDPLGFLSALGTFRLLSEHHDRGTRLSWERARGSAVLHTSFASTAEIGNWLVDLALEIPGNGVLPAASPAIPAEKHGTAGSDPMRPPRAEFRSLAVQSETDDAAVGLRWITSISTDLAQDDKGRAELTLWMAPSGQQTVRSFFEKALDRIRADPSYLGDAPVRWHRHEGYSGEYLDHRALNDAAASATGSSAELGAPGPTWLAAMALPLLRISGDGNKELTGTLWGRSRQRDRRGRRPLVATWPLWTPALDRDAVAVLLDHPAVREPSDGDLTDRLRVLGVFRLVSAHRRLLEGRNFRGVLAPANLR